MSRIRTPIRAPELAELETLVACATDGSLASAARRMGISRPAVAKRIKNLEALAGRPLLHRSPAGVVLTDAGAAVLAGARRMLDDRDVLVGVLSELRSEAPSGIAGLRSLLGNGDVGARLAQLPETRLADAERLLELILGTTDSAVAVSNLETGVVHEVNEAFCRYAGRTREQLLGRRANRSDWYDSAERSELIDDLRRDGVIRAVITKMVRPDGTIRVGSSTTYMVSISGETVLLAIIEDVTERYPEEAKPGADTFPLVRQVPMQS
jgi:PAS domain S-box-containing protein